MRSIAHRNEGHQDKEARRKHDEYIESLEFRTTTEQAIRQAREEAEEKARQQAARRKELGDLNLEQTTCKRRTLDEDKAFDIKCAQEAVEELRQEQEDAIAERLVRPRKSELNGQRLSTQLGKVQVTNDEAERFLQAAQDEVNRREDELRSNIWRQEASLSSMLLQIGLEPANLMSSKGSTKRYKRNRKDKNLRKN